MKKILPFLFLLALISCKKETSNPADAIYFGGDILTMEGDQPTYAEAVAIQNGKIIFVGSKTEAENFHGDKTVMNDLQGKTLLPGFIDAHGHVWNAGFQAVSANLLPAPDGTGNDIPTIISLLKEWNIKNPESSGQIWLDCWFWLR